MDLEKYRVRIGYCLPAISYFIAILIEIVIIVKDVMVYEMSHILLDL